LPSAGCSGPLLMQALPSALAAADWQPQAAGWYFLVCSRTSTLFRDPLSELRR